LSEVLGFYVSGIECGIFNFGLRVVGGFYRKKFDKKIKNLTFILVLRFL
jgi:hypothetical protein